MTGEVQVDICKLVRSLTFSPSLRRGNHLTHAIFLPVQGTKDYSNAICTLDIFGWLQIFTYNPRGYSAFVGLYIGCQDKLFASPGGTSILAVNAEGSASLISLGPTVRISKVMRGCVFLGHQGDPYLRDDIFVVASDCFRLLSCKIKSPTEFDVTMLAKETIFNRELLLKNRPGFVEMQVAAMARLRGSPYPDVLFRWQTLRLEQHLDDQDVDVVMFSRLCDYPVRCSELEFMVETRNVHYRKTSNTAHYHDLVVRFPDKHGDPDKVANYIVYGSDRYLLNWCLGVDGHTLYLMYCMGDPLDEECEIMVLLDKGIKKICPLTLTTYNHIVFYSLDLECIDRLCDVHEVRKFHLVKDLAIMRRTELSSVYRWASVVSQAGYQMQMVATKYLLFFNVKSDDIHTVVLRSRDKTQGFKIANPNGRHIWAVSREAMFFLVGIDLGMEEYSGGRIKVFVACPEQIDLTTEGECTKDSWKVCKPPNTERIYNSRINFVVYNDTTAPIVYDDNTVPPGE